VAAYSKKRFAAAAALLLRRHPEKDVVPVLAQEIVAQGWTRDVPQILQALQNELWHRHKLLCATVTSAQPLSSSAVAAIRDWLAEYTGASEIQIAQQHDGDLIGGALVEGPEFVVDISIRATLNHLRTLHHV
jgi:F0F1-type ATP synthase delta subunit